MIFITVAFIYKYDKIDISYIKSYLSLLLISNFNFLNFFIYLKNKIHSSTK